MIATMPTMRRAFTLIELLVVIGIIAVLVGLLLPAVQRVRESANRLKCANNLKQLGIALHNYHSAHECWPPGLDCASSNTSDAEATGFTHLLPFLEQDNTFRIYHFDEPWYQQANFAPVAVEIKLFYCPTNRDSGSVDLTEAAQEWQTPLPPTAASCDYAFCHGANGSANKDWYRIPVTARGVFNIRPPDLVHSGIRLTDVADGTSNTIAMGDASAGNSYYLVRDLKNPDEPAINTFTGQPMILEQSWSAAGIGDGTHPWYGSVFGVTAQYGLGPDPRDEPMSRRPATPSLYGGDPKGDNASGRDYLGGFRSFHPEGCNFLFCDGGVHFLKKSIQPEVYRALSTYAGSEVVAESDF
jgi:prepilin-type N-terminal cleavage/methylation domain-containing protein/prepilin-type processing-associated H-X9-DG protein